jgi:chromosomal replication initiator protein
MMEETEFWELCLDKFSKKLTNQQINTWIKPLSFKASKNQSTIHAPNQFVLEWVKDRFDKEISLLAKEYLNTENIEYLVTKKGKKKDPLLQERPQTKFKKRVPQIQQQTDSVKALILIIL